LHVRLSQLETQTKQAEFLLQTNNSYSFPDNFADPSKSAQNGSAGAQMDGIGSIFTTGSTEETCTGAQSARTERWKAKFRALAESNADLVADEAIPDMITEFAENEVMSI
jgi:hypothetical protein